VCGRFISLLSPELLESVYGVRPPASLAPRYNIAPTQQVHIVREDDAGTRECAEVRWGLVPQWAKDISIGNKLINARSETVIEKTIFPECHPPSPLYSPDLGVFRVGGNTKRESASLHDYSGWLAFFPLPVSGKPGRTFEGGVLESCALLTTNANSLMAMIHERMPVILQPADFEAWMDRSVTDPHELQRIYQPYPAELMQEWPVSTFVNSPAHSGEECIHPVT